MNFVQRPPASPSGQSKRKPHNHYAGYQFERKCPRLGGHLVCVIASEAGIDHQGKYANLLECEDKSRSRIGPSFTSLPKARKFVRDELDDNSLWDWQF